ncbi:hypothetical protein GQ457_06G008570 [Hibiscus cannabinus]
MEYISAFTKPLATTRWHGPLIVWQLPPIGWGKLNSNGAVRTSDNMVVLGGVIRDEKCGWIFGFSQSIGQCSVIAVKPCVVHDLLRYAWTLGLRKVLTCIEQISNKI